MTGLPFEHVSYLGIVVVLVLTGSGLPIPEEVVVIAAGAAASYGQLNPWLALASCLAGALLGDAVMYGIGYRFGQSVLREHPWWARFLKPAREKQIEGMIRRHGLKVFFAARFLVGLRSPVYLTAGILKVPFRRFLLVDLLSATLVIGLFFGLSFVFAEEISVWWNTIHRAQTAITVVLVLSAVGLAGFFWWRHVQRSRADAPKLLAAPLTSVTLERQKNVA